MTDRVVPATPQFDSGVPFHVGVVRGLRSFDVRSDGVLTGRVQRTHPWQAGENVAVHVGSLRPVMTTYSAGPRPFLDYAFVEKDHQIAALGCVCGFYAYFGATDAYRLVGRTVTGIIEGYGHVTAGSLGFRAERARIVALVNPTPWWARGATLLGLPRLRVTELFDSVVDRYSVPVYRSTADALRHHPTERP